MAFTLVFCMFVVALLFAWLLIHRWRLAWLENRVEDLGLDDAIAERRAEALPADDVEPTDDTPPLVTPGVTT